MQNAEYPQLPLREVEFEDLKHFAKLISERRNSTSSSEEKYLRYDLIKSMYTSPRWIEMFVL